jgi:hypothetical protein
MTTIRRSTSRRLLARTVLVTGCAVVLSACGASDDTPAGPGPDVPAGAAEASFVSLDAVPEAVEAAIADASERFGVPEEEVAVAGALRVTWSDGSLGCPEDGTMYTQALVPGYLLTIEVAGQRVEYHGADGQAPFLCER